MGNVLKPHLISDVLALVRAQLSFREIEQKLGVRRETVSKYAIEAGLWSPPSKPAMTAGVATGSAGVDSHALGSPGTFDVSVSPTPQRLAITASKCVPWQDWIAGEVRKGRNAVAIYQDLVELHGFSGRYNSVKRFVRRLRRQDPQQYDRLEFLPGEEAQVDYGQGALTRHPETGKMRRPRLFVMTLCYSRRAFRKVVWNSSQETFARLHEEAFRYFGGCPQYIVLDNLREGVIKPDIYEPKLNPVYQATLAHYGVVADPARVADPDRKGIVENAIQHTQGTALKGRTFDTIEAQNDWLMHWEEHWAAPRIHGRTRRQVSEMFAEERPSLKPLPLTSVRYFEQGVRTVWDDGCIEVLRSSYAALPAPIFSKVIVRIYPTEIEILNPTTMTLIRRHPKSHRPGAVRMEESDRIFNPSRMTGKFLEQAASIGPKTQELFNDLFHEEGRWGQRSMRNILSLTKKHRAEVIEQACSLAVVRRVRSGRIVREIVERLEAEAAAKNDPVILTQQHDLIRAPTEYGRFFEDHASTADAERQLH